MVRLPLVVVFLCLWSSGVQAQMPPHSSHGTAAVPTTAGQPHSEHPSHSPDLGPAGSTYDLRWIDAMVQHHSGALRMSEFVFNIGEPGVGALARQIWQDQAQEIKAMGQWRKAWYPQAPIAPMALKPGGDPDAMADLEPMDPARLLIHRMVEQPPTAATRVCWFLEGMLHHHGGALTMAHDALANSTNPTVRRLARSIIVNQRSEILLLRRMLRHDGLQSPEYHRYDSLFHL